MLRLRILPPELRRRRLREQDVVGLKQQALPACPPSKP